MLGERGEADAGADAAGLVEQAVVELGAGAEAAVHGLGIRVGVGVWVCVDGGGLRADAGDGGAGFARVQAEVVEAPDAEQGAVGAVEVLGAVFAVVVLEQGEDGAAVYEARVADGGDAELAGWGDAPEVEGFEGGAGEEETAVEESV